jgi:hypothetical protein
MPKATKKVAIAEEKLPKKCDGGVTWDGDAQNMLQVDLSTDRWTLLTTKNSETKALPVSRKIAQALLDGGMTYGS